MQIALYQVDDFITIKEAYKDWNFNRLSFGETYRVAKADEYYIYQLEQRTGDHLFVKMDHSYFEKTGPMNPIQFETTIQYDGYEHKDWPPKQSALGVQIGGSHYKDKGIQPVEYAFANNLGFAEANVVKYVTRWKDKGGVQDLKKARHYLDMLIEFQEKQCD